MAALLRRERADPVAVVYAASRISCPVSRSCRSSGCGRSWSAAAMRPCQRCHVLTRRHRCYTRSFLLLLVQPCWRRYYVCRSSPYASSLKGATHTARSWCLAVIESHEGSQQPNRRDCGVAGLCADGGTSKPGGLVVCTGPNVLRYCSVSAKNIYSCR